MQREGANAATVRNRETGKGKSAGPGGPHANRHCATEQTHRELRAAPQPASRAGAAAAGAAAGGRGVRPNTGGN